MVQLEYELIENNLDYQEDRRSKKRYLVCRVAPICHSLPLIWVVLISTAALLINILIIRISKLYEVACHVPSLIREIELHW